MDKDMMGVTRRTAFEDAARELQKVAFDSAYDARTANHCVRVVLGLKHGGAAGQAFDPANPDSTVWDGMLAAPGAMLPVTNSDVIEKSASAIESYGNSELAAKLRSIASPVAGWVSVEDERKPAEHEVVAVIGPAYGSFDKGRYVSSATYYNGEFFTEDGDQMHPPSHWQHLPPAPVTPKQEQSNG